MVRLLLSALVADVLICLRFLARELIRAFSYMVKIKIEFIVLNTLVKYSQRAQKRANGITGQVKDLENTSSETVKATLSSEHPWNNPNIIANELDV
jgi:hypothetical protein